MPQSSYRLVMPTSLFWLLPLLLLSLSIYWQPVGVEGRVVKFNLTIATNQGVNITKTFDVDNDTLKDVGITTDDLERTLARADDDGKVREVVVRGRHIPIHIDVKRDLGSLVYSFVMLNETRWSVSNANYTNVTLDDFKGDPTLDPLQVSLDWSESPDESTVCNFTLVSAPLHTSMEVNNKSILHEHVNGSLPVGRVVILVPLSGIYLRVINPHTGQLTLKQYFNTDEYFIDQELIAVLTSLRKGRLALITTYYDVSGRFGGESREIVSSLGSSMVQHLRFRDCWAWAWVVGRGSLGEALVINRLGTNSLPNPLKLEVSYPPPDTADRWCDNWPSDEDRWNKRRHFCDRYDGYGDLCSCEETYDPRQVPKINTWREDIGIVIITGNRTKYLYRLLKQVWEQPGVPMESVFVSVDGHIDETLKLLELFPLKYRVHQPEGSHNARITRHMRFALFTALEILPVDKFIILEDDLMLSPDFYSYMQQTSLILDKDRSVFCISAYSHFSYEHTAFDATRLNRVHSFPSYGWMVSRAFLNETLPMWLPVEVQTDWDYWMGSGLVRKGREIVLPEIPRTAHAGLQGAHVSGFLTMKRFSNKPLSSYLHTKVNLTMVERSVFEKELNQLLDQATLLNVTNPYNFSFPNASGEVGLVFVKFRHEEDIKSFRILADALKVWSQDARDHHFGLWRLPYYQATLLIVGVPYSKYSKYYRKGYNIIRANSDTVGRMMDNFDEDLYHFRSHLYNDDKRILGISDDQSFVSYYQQSDITNENIDPITTFAKEKIKIFKQRDIDLRLPSELKTKTGNQLVQPETAAESSTISSFEHTTPSNLTTVQ